MQSDTIRPSTQAIPRWLPIPVHALMSRYLVSYSMTGRSYPMRRQTRLVDDQSQLCIQQQQLTNLLAFVECWPLLRTFGMQQKGKTQPSGLFRMANNPLDRLEACQILGLVGLSLLFGWSSSSSTSGTWFLFFTRSAGNIDGQKCQRQSFLGNDIASGTSRLEPNQTTERDTFFLTFSKTTSRHKGEIRTETMAD